MRRWKEKEGKEASISKKEISSRLLLDCSTPGEQQISKLKFGNELVPRTVRLDASAQSSKRSISSSKVPRRLTVFKPKDLSMKEAISNMKIALENEKEFGSGVNYL